MCREQEVLCWTRSRSIIRCLNGSLNSITTLWRGTPISEHCMRTCPRVCSGQISKKCKIIIARFKCRLKESCLTPVAAVHTTLSSAAARRHGSRIMGAFPTVWQHAWFRHNNSTFSQLYHSALTTSVTLYC